MAQRIKDLIGLDGLIHVLAMGRVLHRNMIQMVGIHGGFHGFWFDIEHAGITIDQLEVATLAARSQNLDCFCRIPPTDYAIVTRCMEAGAGGVMAAQIHSAEEAERFVRWSKFYPRGHRGMNLGGWDARFGTTPAAEFCERANRESLVLIQIETTGAVQECDAIAAIDGVDMLFIGPVDLSQSLGVPGDVMNKKCLDAIDRVSVACKNHGKHWGAVTLNPEHADMLVGKGCKMLSAGSDTRIVNAGIQAIKREYGKFFE